MKQFLSLPLNKRCEKLEHYLSNTSLKELHVVLPVLLENIFGFGPETGWRLDEVIKSNYSNDFQTLRNFLSPSGFLFKAILNLQQDPYMSFEFPLSCLPMATQRRIDERSPVSPYIGQRLHVVDGAKLTLVLNAFELFMFHFAYYMVNPKFSQSTSQWHSMEDCLYPVLLEDYMTTFLPLASASHISAAGQLAGSRHSPTQVRHMPGHLVSPRLPAAGATSLLRRNLVSGRHHRSQPMTHDISNIHTGPSDTVIQVFSEFWLGQVPMSMSESSPSFYSPTFETRLPSVNVVILLRCLIKYLHYFTNSAAPEAVVSVYHQPTVSHLDEFKRNCMVQIVQKKLYNFLRYCFERWPLDSSFRLIMETWLSYVQIWRYQNIEDRNASHSYENKDREVSSKWFPFITNNLLFYTVLFQEITNRMLRLDLTSPFSAYMLFRYTKVFSQKNLKNLIQQAEDPLKEQCSSHLRNHDYSDIGESFLSPRQNISLTVTSHFSDLEPSNYIYQHFFSEASRRQVELVLKLVISARSKLSNQKMEPDGSSSGWLSWLQDAEYDMTYRDVGHGELRKLDQHLDASARNLSYIFDLPASTLDEVDQGSTFHVSDTEASDDATPCTPHCYEDDGAIKLSDIGRHQVVNGLRRFNVIYNNDPDEGPIKSCESAVAVRILYHLCTLINNVYQDHMTSLCTRENFLGSVARVVFRPVIPSEPGLSSPMTREQRNKLSRPRLSLRALAQYRNIATILLLYLLTRLLFGFGLFEFVLAGSTLFSFVVLIKAATMKQP